MVLERSSWDAVAHAQWTADTAVVEELRGRLIDAPHAVVRLGGRSGLRWQGAFAIIRRIGMADPATLLRRRGHLIEAGVAGRYEGRMFDAYLAAYRNGYVPHRWWAEVWYDPAPFRRWLNVPEPETDAARTAGARWDRIAKRWYSASPERGPLDAWAAPTARS